MIWQPEALNEPLAENEYESGATNEAEKLDDAVPLIGLLNMYPTPSYAVPAADMSIGSSLEFWLALAGVEKLDDETV